MPECISLLSIICDFFVHATEADPGIYFGGVKPRSPSKVKGEARIEGAKRPRVSRAKPESRARSARELRAKPEPRAKPEKKGGLGNKVSPSPENF